MRRSSTNADQDENRRQGTISSARFNLLSSMVGGGSLSLPLAFHQTGNMFMAPLLLVITSVVAQQSIYFLIKAGIYSTERRDLFDNHNDQLDNNKKGAASYENMASQAFGAEARVLSSVLVSACCFFGTVGYAVLLRDLLEPLVDSVIIPPEGTGGGPTLPRNLAMLSVILLVSALCTMKNLTALKNVGAASMASVLTVGLCVAYRSIECQLGFAEQHDNGNSENKESRESSMQAFPSSMKMLLDAVPLFISSYICHFNVLPIHNELRCPTSDRVRQWVRTSMWPATLFYYVIGLTGSLYAKCTPTGEIQGNILLDFDENDPLLLLGRMCLAMTITLAFPMLVIPARDILVRTVASTRCGRRIIAKDARQSSLTPLDVSDAILSDDEVPNNGLTEVEFEHMEVAQATYLEEPLLAMESRSIASTAPDVMRDDSDEFDENRSTSRSTERDGTDSRLLRIAAAVSVFWSAAFIACSVSSIDIIWDLLGSSFSIMMAFIIPCGSYLKLAGRKRFFNQVSDGGASFRKWMVSRTVAWIMVIVFIPLMIVSTANAVYNCFSARMVKDI
jgi:amino acid permease